MTGVPKPAYETHEDGQDPALRLRLHGCNEIDPRTYSLRELKAVAAKQAANGCDPIDIGTHELGLFLGQEEYETLKAYCKSLTVARSKQRFRRKR